MGEEETGIGGPRKIVFDIDRYNKSLELGRGIPYMLYGVRNTFPWPVDISNSQIKISTFFEEKDDRGLSHGGLDLEGPIGTEVTTPQKGKVRIVEDLMRNEALGTSVGNVYVYNEEDGLLHVFGHLSLDDVISRLQDGQTVEAGQIVGSIGNFYPGKQRDHLHYEVQHSYIKSFVIPLVGVGKINPLQLLEDLRTK